MNYGVLYFIIPVSIIFKKYIKTNFTFISLLVFTIKNDVIPNIFCIIN